MLNLKKQEEDIIKNLKNIKKNACPNIFVSGKSTQAMETLSLKMVETLENQKVMDFKGIHKHFTILMPYYESQDMASQFMKHLLESISIARDCYDSYCGFVLVELSEKWGIEGYNPALDHFLDFILRSQDKIRFVIVCPEVKKSTELGILFTEFVKCGPCINISMETTTVHQCVSAFKNMAKDQGYEVSEEAETVLRQRLKERAELRTESMEAVTGLINQIIFDKNFRRIKSRKIEAEDIQKYFPFNRRKSRSMIGFARESE